MYYCTDYLDPFGFQRRLYYAFDQKFDFKMRRNHRKRKKSYERCVNESTYNKSLS